MRTGIIEVIGQNLALADNSLYISFFGKDILLFAPSGATSWALLNLILCAAGVILATLITTRFLFQKRRESISDHNNSDPSEEDINERCYRLTCYTTALTLSTAGVFLYFLTRDRSSIMSLVDLWSLLHTLFFAAEIISFILVGKSIKRTRCGFIGEPIM